MDWLESVQDASLKEYATAAGFKDVAGVLAAHKGLRDQLARGGFKVPGPDAKPEERAAFRKALGIPEAPDGYKLTKPEKLPRGMTWDDNVTKDFLKFAHENDLTPRQVEALIKYEIGRHEGKLGLLEKAKKDAEKALRDEWGDQYDAKTALITKALRALTESDEDAAALEDMLDITGYGSRPGVAKALARLGELLSDDQAPTGDTGGDLNEADAAAAREELEQLSKDPEFAKKLFAGDQDANRRFQELNRKAEGKAGQKPHLMNPGAFAVNV